MNNRTAKCVLTRCKVRVSIKYLAIALICQAKLGFAAHYELSIEQDAIKLLDSDQKTYSTNRSIPSPTLHWQEGEWVTLNVTNRMQEETSLHWHGIILPYDMDGVPNISFHGIKPGESFRYHFQVKQSGTYWYHGHSGMQEQLGLYGAILIDPIKAQDKVQHDYVVMLSDFPAADPERSLARLKKQSDYYNYQKRTVFTFWDDMARMGFLGALKDRLDWGEMRMEPTDLSDVTGATYQYLLNGQATPQPWQGLFEAGEKVRLRFINASSMTHFDIRIPGLKMQVVEADGQAVKPVSVDEFRIAVAETYSVIVAPDTNDKAYKIFAEAMDRSGFVAADLTPRADLSAPMPEMRPMQLLTMADMGTEHQEHAAHAPQAEEPMASMAGMSHAEHHAMSGHQQHGMPMTTMPDIDHSQHQMMSGHQHHMMLGTDSYKVLDYTDLVAAQPSEAWAKVDREIKLRLTGNMHRYIWSFDDVKYENAEPIHLRYGEHVRFTYVNETMMNHPIHMHGLWQYLDTGRGRSNPKKHVINVKPGKSVSVDVLADALGEWAFHCHLMYHMETGMFRKLIITQAGDTLPLNHEH